MSKKRVVIYCDGASNSFGSAICICLKKDNGKHIYHVVPFIKKTPVMRIEYKALICALEISNNDCTIFTDNLRIEEWVTGKKPTYTNLDMFEKARKIYMEKEGVTIKWISRDKNLAGKHLEARLETLKEDYKGMSKLPKRKRIKKKSP